MKRGVLCAVVMMLWALAAQGQGALGDILSGRLVQPEVGAWAWYDLTNPAGERECVMRMAIVSKEKVGAKEGYWLELEVTPMVGFKSIYKMLLTGPASDPANIHKMLRREGTNNVEQMPLQKPETKEGEKSEVPKEPERTLVGKEDITTAGGPVNAEHYELNVDDKKMDLWTNEGVRPMGIVRMKSADGGILLRNYGVGGPDARSVIDDKPEGTQGKEGVKVDVRVEKSEKKSDKKPAKGATP